MVLDGKQKKNFDLVLCFILGLIVASVAFIPFIIQGQGAFTLTEDFNDQQLTFATIVWDAFHDGQSGQWVWSLDLGLPLIGGFSFYNLGSPFFWGSLLFPRGAFPYLAGGLYILKYAVAVLTAYIYLRGFFRKENKDNQLCAYAMIGSLLYAFSGFQTVNLLFFSFHDVVALFPLLLWGIENIGNKKIRPIFIFIIFINCLTNYFFFIQEVIFMAIYYLLRYWGRPIRQYIQNMLVCVVCGLVGVGMASIVFIPSILYVMSSSRSSSSIDLASLVYDSKTLLLIIKGMIMPGEAMTSQSAIMPYSFDSTSCYIPLFGLAFVIEYIRQNNNWLKKLLVLCFIISASPLLQSGFVLFTQAYQRWWFTFVLMMALATAKVLENAGTSSSFKGGWYYMWYSWQYSTIV